MNGKLTTIFMRSQWKIIVADRRLTEKEVYELIKAFEKYLDRPGVEPVRQVMVDYNSFVSYVQKGVAKKIFPAMWPQYLMSAKVGFLRYKSYRDILPPGTPIPSTMPPPATAKPAPRSASRFSPQEEQHIKTILKFFYPNEEPPAEITDEVANLASKMLLQAIESSKAMDFVPRPAGFTPGVGWLISQAVQMWFRTQGKQKIYESVRVTVALKYKSEFAIAMEGL